MSETGLHKGFIGKYFGWSISRNEFAEALDAFEQRICKETGRRPSLTLEFERAAHKKMTEIPEWNAMRIVEQVKNTRLSPRELWNTSDRVTASFIIAANENEPGLIATVWRTRGKPKEIHYEIEPPEIGRKIGDFILHAHPRYTFWTRGLD